MFFSPTELHMLLFSNLKNANEVIGQNNASKKAVGSYCSWFMLFEWQCLFNQVDRPCTCIIGNKINVNCRSNNIQYMIKGGIHKIQYMYVGKCTCTVCYNKLHKDQKLFFGEFFQQIWKCRKYTNDTYCVHFNFSFPLIQIYCRCIHYHLYIKLI